VASNRARSRGTAIIIAALLVFAILIIGTRPWVVWPNFVGTVAETITTTTHYKSGRGEQKVREIETVRERQRVTFWHLVGALFIPLAGGLLVAWGGFKFNQKQRERDEVIENKQAQDNAIQAYLDQMSDLLVDRHLRSLPKGSDIHKLAEAKTVDILLGLDSERKRRPLKLVYGLGLINNRLHTAERDGAPLDVENLNPNNPDTGERDGALLDLENLSLDHADLTELSLRDACLRFADLRGANLQGSDLSGADLSYADLRGANLTNTDLSAVNLSGANLLPYDEHEPARLSLHNLKDYALPSDNYLRSLAKLQEERLQGLSSRLTRRVKNRLLRRKPVTFTNLTDAKLAGANLTGAILANADLRHTRRSLDRKQIERAVGNDKTKLPDTDEFKPLPPGWTSNGIEAQIKKVEVQVLEERKKNAVEVWEERIKNTVEQINEHSNE
jgi:uncharacterized protein YjbI with pentapeptide repeats